MGEELLACTSSVVGCPNNTNVMAEEEQDMAANCLVLLSRGGTLTGKRKKLVGAFECKTCNRTFPSFQALGGHTTTHRIKPQQQQQVSNSISMIISNFQPASSFTTNHKNNKVHRCSICGSEYFSGQALGGHMRRHRAIPTASRSHNAVVSSRGTSMGSKDGSFSTELEEGRRSLLSTLDLNLPAPEDAGMVDKN